MSTNRQTGKQKLPNVLSTYYLVNKNHFINILLNLTGKFQHDKMKFLKWTFYPAVNTCQVWSTGSNQSVRKYFMRESVFPRHNKYWCQNKPWDELDEINKVLNGRQTSLHYRRWRCQMRTICWQWVEGDDSWLTGKLKTIKPTVIGHKAKMRLFTHARHDLT